jgi:hypothetical protein
MGPRPYISTGVVFWVKSRSHSTWRFSQAFSLGANAITLLLEQIGFPEPAGAVRIYATPCSVLPRGFDPHSGQDDLGTAPTAMIEFTSNLKPAEVAGLPRAFDGNAGHGGDEH